MYGGVRGLRGQPLTLLDEFQTELTHTLQRVPSDLSRLSELILETAVNRLTQPQLVA